jgi:hypothetical protein
MTKDEFELRGKLATLKCWHRMTQEEVEDLLSFAAAQPKQEPLAPQPAQQEPTVCIHAWFSTGAMADGVCRCIKCGVWWNTITPPTPPQRKALTNEQIEKCIEAADSKWADAFVSVEWARHLTKAIEAAHGIKETTK